jgi:UDP-N-acetylmuramyl pentapeptide synthase/poly-gamma-glutamate capsule biosynthesis protein CapA/YwtB (metallophosphatase superfamily)
LLTEKTVRRLAPYAAGILCENGREYLDFGLPVLEVASSDQALMDLARFARNHFEGKIVAVTGSSGKTGTIYLMNRLLSKYGLTDHSRGSLNMIQPIMRVMASMSRELSFWIVEAAFGKLDISAPVIRPDVAIVLSIYASHLARCANIRQVAEFKSRIFTGMEEGSHAVLNRDMNEFDVVRKAAEKRDLNIVLYGRSNEAHIRLLNHAGGRAEVLFFKQKLDFPCGLSRHELDNSLGALACVHALGYPVDECLELLANDTALPGRGRRHHATLGEKPFTLMDDSYNANPGSMKAALSHLRDSTPAASNRLAILGECLTLGDGEQELHLELIDPILAAAPDRILLCGTLMRRVWDGLKGKIKGSWYPDPETLSQDVTNWIKAGDTVLVKSSGHKLTDIVRRLLNGHYSRPLPARGVSPDSPGGVEVAIGGNVSIGRFLHCVQADRGPAYSLKDVTGLREADFSLANLNCVIADRAWFKVDKGRPAASYDRARPEQMNILRQCGLRLALTANGHAGDYGPEAQLDCGSYLKAAGLRTAGSGKDLQDASSPAFVKIGGYDAAIFAIDCSTPKFAAAAGTPGVWHLPPVSPDLWYVELSPRVAAARKKAHIVLVAVHWKDSMAGRVPLLVAELGRACIAAGADAVLGSASVNDRRNAVGGVEIHHHRPIIWDTGLLLTPAHLPHYPDAGLFSLSVAANGVSRVRFSPLALKQGVAQPADVETANAVTTRFIQKCSSLGTVATRAGCGAIIRLCPPQRAAVSPHCTDERPTATSQKSMREMDAACLEIPPLRRPRSEWLAHSVPQSRKISPRRKFGPLILHGFWVSPVVSFPHGGRNLWIESWWGITETVQDDLLISILALPKVKDAFSPFGSAMRHEPCDWQWPTSRWEPGLLYRDVVSLPPSQIDPPVSPTEMFLRFSVSKKDEVLRIWSTDPCMRIVPESGSGAED